MEAHDATLALRGVDAIWPYIIHFLILASHVTRVCHLPANQSSADPSDGVIPADTPTELLNHPA